jgi:hypothetical protein
MPADDGGKCSLIPRDNERAKKDFIRPFVHGGGQPAQSGEWSIQTRRHGSTSATVTSLESTRRR